MIGIDTNLLVRFLVRDDETQARRARNLVENDAIFIPKSVLLETEWVLRYTYEFDRDDVNHALRKVCGLPQVVVEDPFAVRKALSWHAKGLDFADALHLASSQKAQFFCSFDRSLISKAGRLDSIQVVSP